MAPADGSLTVKSFALVCLVVQNTALVMLMRHSRTSGSKGPMYISSTAVFVMEFVKLFTCFGVVYVTAPTYHKFTRKITAEVINKPYEMARLMVPSLLYTVQNNLLYEALTNLDAATYSVCYQLKILTTALFSVIMLGRSLSPMKWGALVLLTAGVALAELSTHSGNESNAASKNGQRPLVGFVCVLAAACTSGFAGVYFESILKGSKTSLWVRNIQMGLPSVVLALFSAFVKDGSDIARRGFFSGYTPLVISVILLQAIGGLVVAVVVKYADNILKSFASAVSILTSTLLSVMFFGFRPTMGFMLAVVLVSASVFIYGRPAPKDPKETPLGKPPRRTDAKQAGTLPTFQPRNDQRTN